MRHCARSQTRKADTSGVPAPKVVLWTSNLRLFEFNTARSKTDSSDCASGGGLSIFLVYVETFPTPVYLF